LLCITPAAASEDPGQLFVQQRLEQLHFGEERTIGGETIYAAGLLLDLYRKNRFQPLWTDRRNLTQLLTAIAGSAEEGLIPDDYHLQAISRYGHELETAPSRAKLLEYDLLLSDALMLLAQHKRHGKVNPREVEERLNLDSPAPRPSLIDTFLNALRTATVRKALDELEPAHPAYASLKRALSRYRKIAGSGGWQSVPPGPSLKPGMRDDRVQALRARLAVTGDLTWESAHPLFYDEVLAGAVRAFQTRHHLEADGIAGKATLAAMNIPVAGRISQIRVNLERARWVMHDMPDSSIVIDIAGFNLQYYHQNRLVWKTRVMVGEPFNQTPVFRSAITYLVLNPTWTIPPDILKNETVPRILTEKDYLAKQRLRVLTASGEEVNPATVPWGQYLGKRPPYTLRQDAGPDNALGLIKFIFPNPYHVYLHDTPSKSLFDKARRAFSHGCIRVQHPLDLGKMLIANDPGNPTSAARFDQILASGKTSTIFLKEPLPIFLMYLTANAENGQVQFMPDLYQRDQGILDALNGPPSLLEHTTQMPEFKSQSSISPEQGEKTS
jgi:murein L,D-transpeptidase YcbB/YkuD